MRSSYAGIHSSRTSTAHEIYETNFFCQSRFSLFAMLRAMLHALSILKRPTAQMKINQLQAGNCSTLNKTKDNKYEQIPNSHYLCRRMCGIHSGLPRAERRSEPRPR
jgi:hypothetical protein